jgi:death-on-curing protein
VNEPTFLTIDYVLILHRLAINADGGSLALLDRGKLESALAQPQQRFGGEWLHPDVPAMAAAYAFHIAKNHPFEDGNKRAAAAAMLAFLHDNGFDFEPVNTTLADLILRMAAGELDKPAFTDAVRAAVVAREG